MTGDLALGRWLADRFPRTVNHGLTITVDTDAGESGTHEAMSVFVPANDRQAALVRGDRALAVRELVIGGAGAVAEPAVFLAVGAEDAADPPLVLFYSRQAAVLLRHLVRTGRVWLAVNQQLMDIGRGEVAEAGEATRPVAVSADQRATVARFLAEVA